MTDVEKYREVHKAPGYTPDKLKRPSYYTPGVVDLDPNLLQLPVYGYEAQDLVYGQFRRTSGGRPEIFGRTNHFPVLAYYGDANTYESSTQLPYRNIPVLYDMITVDHMYIPCNMLSNRVYINKLFKRYVKSYLITVDWYNKHTRLQINNMQNVLPICNNVMAYFDNVHKLSTGVINVLMSTGDSYYGDEYLNFINKLIEDTASVYDKNKAINVVELPVPAKKCRMDYYIEKLLPYKQKPEMARGEKPYEEDIRLTKKGKEPIEQCIEHDDYCIQ